MLSRDGGMRDRDGPCGLSSWGKGGEVRAKRPVPGGALILLLLAALVSCRKTPSRPFLGVKALDVVLVTIDTLRADAPGFAGDTRVATPNLDRIAREGVVFENAHAQNVITLPSHVNILTGMYPYQHGVRDNDGFRLRENVPTLATRLKATGFAAAAFIGAFPLESRYGLARGFDVYDQNFPQGSGGYELKIPERPAAEVVAPARRWLAKPPAGSRFLWVHLYDCHAPYTPPPPFDKTYASEPYLGEVAGVDAALGPLFDDLRRSGRTVLLVVTGDHGEALGDHGELTHGLFAYEATLHVPLLLWSPGRLAPRRESVLARHIDIAPTVLEASGVPLPPGELPGQSLLSRSKVPETSYFEALTCSLNRGWAPLRGVLSGGYKYIDLPVPELYDLARDPKETNNLYAARREEAGRFARMLPRETGAPKPATASAEEAARLRSLGYLAGSAAPKTRYTAEDDPKTLVGLDSELHRLVELYQENHLSEAAALGRKIIAERPAMETGYEFLSLTLVQAGDEKGAIDTLEEGRRRGILSEELLGRLGLLYAERGEARRARTILEPLSGSEDVEVLNALGIARSGDGDLPGAMESFHRALERDPRNATAYQNIGIADLQYGKAAEALAAFDRAFALNDHLPRAWNAKGVALEKIGRPKEAMEAWKRAFDLDPHQFDALYNLALVSGQQGDLETARWALERFASSAPAGRYHAEIDQAKSVLARMGAKSSRPGERP
jgi:arylsulfatase A-like enzyme/Flp pilus assembly protein TadD